MKVKLTGINYEGLDETEQYYIDLLKQVPYPIVTETVEDTFVCLKDYIKSPDEPCSEEEWGLIWFTYEEVKD